MGVSAICLLHYMGVGTICLYTPHHILIYTIWVLTPYAYIHYMGVATICLYIYTIWVLALYAYIHYIGVGSVCPVG